MTHRLAPIGLIVLALLGCEDKPVSPTPPAKPPATNNEPEDQGLEIEGTLGLEKVGGSPGKNSEVYRIGGQEYYSLTLAKQDPRLAEALHKGKVLLKPAKDAKAADEQQWKALVGKAVLVRGRVRPQDRSDWDNPNHMQALVEMDPDGTRRTIRPGSIGAFIVTELRAR